MPRPAKSVHVISKNLTEEERQLREETEKILKGGSTKIKPFDYLTVKQIEIFKYLVSELKASGIIGNIDVYVLNKCAVAIDRLNTFERMANDNEALLLDSDFLKARKDYTADFYKCCQELCLSPQARAKVGSIKLNKKSDREAAAFLKELRGG